MPKVFTGRVAIPAEQFDEYLKRLAEAEKQREPFRHALEELLEDFRLNLSERYTALFVSVDHVVASPEAVTRREGHDQWRRKPL